MYSVFLHHLTQIVFKTDIVGVWLIMNSITNAILAIDSLVQVRGGVGGAAEGAGGGEECLLCVCVCIHFKVIEWVCVCVSDLHRPVWSLRPAGCIWYSQTLTTAPHPNPHVDPNPPRGPKPWALIT